MCGIVGYVGPREARTVLLNALHRVEYRGYDSCGIAIRNGEGFHVFKDTGFVEELQRKVPPLEGTLGIGHTRWATVGAPSESNAHPHLDCSGAIAIVHNGDIDNYYELRQQLQDRGHRMRSETDSEVLAHLIEAHCDGDLRAAVVRALREVRGSYALLAMSSTSDVLVAARRENPLVVGMGSREGVVASDVPALLETTESVAYLEDGDLATIGADGLQVWHDETPAVRRVHQVSWSLQDLDKAGYDHYFLKEVHEQPHVIRDTFAGKVFADEPRVDVGVPLPPEPPESILFAACGTAYYAGLAGADFLAALGGCPTTVRVASELEGVPPPGRNAWAVFITQSGETADTISAARAARDAGYRTLALTNSPDSSITRVVQQSLYTEAGPEVSVAASKTLMGQLIALYLLGLQLYPPPASDLQRLLAELRLLPGKVERVLALEDRLSSVARGIASRNSVFLIARGVSLPVAMEGALKLKELAYVHAEAYPAGELKHGPFALLSRDVPVIALMPRDRTYGRLLNTIREIKARGSPVIAVTDVQDPEVAGLVDDLVELPSTEDVFSPVLSTVALQLLAYHCARERGCPIDRPRHLAKSVTVH